MDLGTPSVQMYPPSTPPEEGTQEGSCQERRGQSDRRFLPGKGFGLVDHAAQDLAPIRQQLRGGLAEGLGLGHSAQVLFHSIMSFHFVPYARFARPEKDIEAPAMTATAPPTIR